LEETGQYEGAGSNVMESYIDSQRENCANMKRQDKARIQILSLNKEQNDRRKNKHQGVALTPPKCIHHQPAPGSQLFHSNIILFDFQHVDPDIAIPRT
jgi:hypothetical protein